MGDNLQAVKSAIIYDDTDPKNVSENGDTKGIDISAVVWDAIQRELYKKDVFSFSRALSKVMKLRFDPKKGASAYRTLAEQLLAELTIPGMTTSQLLQTLVALNMLNGIGEEFDSIKLPLLAKPSITIKEIHDNLDRVCSSKRVDNSNNSATSSAMTVDGHNRNKHKHYRKTGSKQRPKRDHQPKRTESGDDSDASQASHASDTERVTFGVLIGEADTDSNNAESHDTSGSVYALPVHGKNTKSSFWTRGQHTMCVATTVSLLIRLN